MTKGKITALVALGFFLSGCAQMSYRQEAVLKGAGAGALTGAAIGGAASAGSDDKNRSGLGVGIGAASGALIGGLLGYFLAEEPKPPPPPPAPKPAPKVERTIILDHVLFDFDKTAIKPDGAKILDRLVTFLKENPDKKVDLEGHTDWIGTEKYNQGLSERRAASVKNYLVKKGVDVSRIATRGFGKTKPIADNKTRDGRAKNRRVEVKVR